MRGARSSPNLDAPRPPGSLTAARTAAYHSLQATLNRRVAGGLFLKGAYTYSHAIDMANYGDWTGFSWNAPSVFYRNRASATNNIPHMFQLGYLYEVPFGSGKKWATSGLSKAVL